MTSGERTLDDTEAQRGRDLLLGRAGSAVEDEPAHSADIESGVHARDRPRVVGLELLLHILLVLAEQLRVQLDVAGLLDKMSAGQRQRWLARPLHQAGPQSFLRRPNARRHRGPARVRLPESQGRTLPNAAAIENMGVTSAKAL